MAISSEILGKLGGADVEVIPVSAPDASQVALCNLDLDPDKTYLVGVSGICTTAPGSVANQAEISIGDSISGYARTAKQLWGTAGLVSGPVEVFFSSYSTSGNLTSDFDGEVYVVEVDL